MKIERVQLIFKREKPADCRHYKSSETIKIEEVNSQAEYLLYLETYCNENEFKLLSVNDIVSNGTRYSVANIIKENESSVD